MSGVSVPGMGMPANLVMALGALLLVGVKAQPTIRTVQVGYRRPGVPDRFNYCVEHEMKGWQCLHQTTPSPVTLIRFLILKL